MLPPGESLPWWDAYGAWPSWARHVLLVVAVWLLLSMIHGFTVPAFLRDVQLVDRQTDVAARLLHGHASLGTDPTTPSTRMMAAKHWKKHAVDMPDGKQTVIWRPWFDCSWHDGAAYLYFTPWPTVFIYVPAYLLGISVDPRMIVNLLAAITVTGWWSAVVSFTGGHWRLRPMARAIGFAVVVVMSHLLSVLQACDIYEISILWASASAAVVLAMAAAGSGRGMAGGMLLGWCAAMAVTARPTCLPVVAVAVWIWWRSAPPGTAKRAAIAAAAAGCGLIAAWNAIRFGVPWDTGIGHQITWLGRLLEDYPQTLGARVSADLRFYLGGHPWMVPQDQSGFHAWMTVDMHGIGNHVTTYGLPWICPVAILGTIIAIARRDRFASTLVLSGWCALLLLCLPFASTAGRYLLDAMGGLIVGSLVAVIAVLPVLGRAMRVVVYITLSLAVMAVLWWSANASNSMFLTIGGNGITATWPGDGHHIFMEDIPKSAGSTMVDGVMPRTFAYDADGGIVPIVLPGDAAVVP